MPADTTFQKLLKDRQRDRGVRGSILLFSIILFFVLVVLWAANTEIDDVTRTDGRIVPSNNLQIVQVPEGGSIERVLVREGDVVEQGALLMEMDQIRFAGHLDQERQQAFALQARLIRLRAEVEGERPVFPDELQAYAADVVVSELDLFSARQAELRAEIDVLTIQMDQQREALAEAENLLRSSEGTHDLVNAQIAAIEPLVVRGLEPQTSLLQLQIQLSEWEGRLAQGASRLAQERSRLVELERRILALESRFRSEALSELSRTITDLAGLAPSLPVLEQRVRETEIRSPIHGVVNRIFVSTLGGVVATGADLVEIVPIEDTLVVEAFVRPVDIAFLHLGQTVNVKITAYDFSRYGALEGEIRRIGASPVPHPDRDENVFAVEISTSTRLEDAVGQPLPIVPGMLAEIEFVSERKTVLDYIIRPVIRVRDRAFRD